MFQFLSLVLVLTYYTRIQDFDKKILENNFGDGACLLTVALDTKTSRIYTAGVGDSMPLLMFRNSRTDKLRPIAPISRHNGENKKEVDRSVTPSASSIMSMSYVAEAFCRMERLHPKIMQDVGGTKRVRGNLAPTRSLGDQDFKDVISAEPEIASLAFNISDKDGSKWTLDSFLAATDGGELQWLLSDTLGLIVMISVGHGETRGNSATLWSSFQHIQ